MTGPIGMGEQAPLRYRRSIRDLEAPLRFDRQIVHATLPTKVVENGREHVEFEVTRFADGSRAELTYRRNADESGLREYCTAKLRNGWAGPDYDGASFLAHRPMGEDAAEVGGDPTHWQIDWHGAPHAGTKTSTIWPGHFHSGDEDRLESLMLLLLDQIDFGVHRVAQTRNILNSETHD